MAISFTRAFNAVLTVAALLALPVIVLASVREGKGIISSLKQRRLQRARNALIDSLFQTHDGPRLGSPLAAQPLIEFLDYECPVCRAADSLVTDITKEGSG